MNYKVQIVFQEDELRSDLLFYVALLLGFIAGVVAIQISTPDEFEVISSNANKVVCYRNVDCYKVIHIEVTE